VIHPESDDEGRSADAAGRSTTFDEIVASWVAEGSVPAWPEDPVRPDSPAPDPASATPPPAAPPPSAAPPPTPPPAAPHRGGGYQVPEEEHFVPPDPPPLPHLGPPAIVGLTLLVLGIILAVTPQVVGLNESAGLPLGLLTLALGLGWLVLRSWPTDDADDDDDDGAVL
jgi:hypothetical protein